MRRRYSSSHQKLSRDRTQGKPDSEIIFPCTPMPMLRNQISRFHDSGGGELYWD